MSKNHDINKLPTDGYLVLPLSMSRLANGKGQSPEECYEIIQYFENKVSQVGIDFLFIYTNGLYYNNDEPALSIRKKTNQAMIDHRNALLKLMVKKEFGVDVVKVFTMNIAGEKKKSYTGRSRVVKPQKKAIVTLKKDQKIDAFDIKE